MFFLPCLQLESEVQDLKFTALSPGSIKVMIHVGSSRNIYFKKSVKIQ